MKKKMEHVLLGCVADDFTGASDAASFLAAEGIRTLLFNGIPEDTEAVRDCAAIVIALKTRSAPADEAVRDTLAAVRWLEAQGAEQFYIKYCSTFDSTPEGNIGPCVDAVLEAYKIPYTLLCPSLPVNGRIVKNGVLIVDGRPIAEGHMAHHPLNPIWDSRIVKLMEPQSKYPCMTVDGRLLAGPKEALLSAVEAFGRDKAHFYVVPDYSAEEEGARIASVFGGLRLLTGGSGILTHLARRYRDVYDCASGEAAPTGTEGRGIALSGSCSTMTGRQCLAYRESGDAVAVYPGRLLAGTQTAEEIWEQVSAAADREVLVYSAGAVDAESRSYRDAETEREASRILERTMAEIARRAYDAGYTRIICAGGETSGAIALELGFDAFIIGESVDPGVPVLTPLHDRNVRLVLKSGNFGGEDFFAKALRMTKRERG